MAKATVVIQGKNKMTQAVNGAVKDLSKIKDSAASASKVLLRAFNIGSAVAVTKLLVKEVKNYASAVDDPKIKKSFDGITTSVNHIKTAFKEVFEYDFKPLFENIDTAMATVASNVTNVFAWVGGAIANLPATFENAIALIADMFQSIWSWDFLKGSIELLFQNVATLFTGLKDAMDLATGGWLSKLWYNIQSDFWNILAIFQSGLENMIETVINGAINALNKLPFVNLNTVGIDLGSSSLKDKSRSAYSKALQADQNSDVVGAVKAVVSTLKTVGSDTKEFLNDTFRDDIARFATSMSDVIGPDVQKILGKISTSNASSDAKNGPFGSILTSLKSAFSSITPFIEAFKAGTGCILVLSKVVEGFVNTLKPAIDTVIQPLLDALSWVGEILAEALFPILDAIYPIVEMLARLIQTIFAPVAKLLAPVVQLVALAFQLLQPIIVLVGKAFTILMAPVQWLGDLFSWLGSWLQYFGQCVCVCAYNLTHWFSRQSYPSSPGSFSSDAFSGLSSRLAQWDTISDTSSGLTSGTSTSTATSSASYQGATQVTINIYQQAPVVGDTGMRQFAQMIRNEFANLDYYGVTT